MRACVWCDCDKCASTISLLSFHIKEKRKIWCKQAIFIGVYYSFRLCSANSQLGQHAQTSSQQHRTQTFLSSINTFLHLFLTNYCVLTILHFNHFRLHRPDDSAPKWINKIIGFIFGLLRRRVSHLLHSIRFIFTFWIGKILLLNWAFGNNKEIARWSTCVCLFVAFLVKTVTNNSIAHVNDSRILK